MARIELGCKNLLASFFRRFGKKLFTRKCCETVTCRSTIYLPKPKAAETNN